MIKFVGTNPTTGDKIIGIGITAANIEKLKEGKPILFKLSDLGLDWPGEVTIFYGETEEKITKELAEAGLIPPIRVGEGKITLDMHDKWPGRKPRPGGKPRE